MERYDVHTVSLSLLQCRVCTRMSSQAALTHAALHSIVAFLRLWSTPHCISSETAAAHSTLFMRFAWMVKPRNYILFACHTSNVAVQSYNLFRWGNAQDWSKGTSVVIKSALPPSMGGPVRGAPK